MARARNIKPGFFTNDDLGDLSPLARLGFIGLWGQADFNGNMKYKPKRLKVEVLPYDNVDFAELVGELQQAGFVEIYQVDGEDYLHVVNFRKHQRPHKNEVLRGTDIPQPVTGDDPNGTDPEQNRTETEQERDENVSNPPDTGYRIPDSGYLNPEKQQGSASADAQPSQKTEPKPPRKKTPAIDYSSWPELPDDQILKDWLKARTKARAVHSQTAINAIGKELHKAVAMGYTVNQCGEEAATRGWRGFKAEWMQSSVAPANRNGVALTGNVTRFPGRQSVDDHNREVARRWAAGGDCYDQE